MDFLSGVQRTLTFPFEGNWNTEKQSCAQGQGRSEEERKPSSVNRAELASGCPPSSALPKRKSSLKREESVFVVLLGKCQQSLLSPRPEVSPIYGEKIMGKMNL